MRLESITVAGVLRFDAPVTLDLRQVPPGLVAVVGANGAGKTTLVEAPIATLYRQFPSRADRELVDYAHGRDGHMEAILAVEGRGTYRARVNLDGLKRTTDAVLEHTAPDGTRTLLNDGKLKSYDEAVAAVFPPQAVLLASAVAAQNRAGSFVGLDKRGRKDLFTELLGLEHYEAMATTARQAAALHDTARATLGATRDVLAGEASDATGEHLTAALAANATDVQVADDDRTKATADRTAARARRAQLVDDAAAYRTATARLRDLATESAALMVRLEALARQRVSASDGASREEAVLAGNLARQVAELRQRITNNARVLEQADDIRAAAAVVEQSRVAETALHARRGELAQQLREAHVSEREGKARLDQADRARVDLAKARQDAGLMGSVPCGGAGPYARCSFLAGAERARLSIPALETAAADLEAAGHARAAAVAGIDDLDRAVAAVDHDLAAARAAAAAAAPTARLLPAIQTAEARITELQADIASADDQGAALLQGVAARLAAALADLDDQYAAAQADLDRVGADTNRCGGEQRRTADAAAALADVDTLLAVLDRRIEDAAAATARLDAAAGELTRRIAHWQSCRTRLEAITAQLRAVEDDGREWALLAKAFGRDGLPVLEIDAAGPTVSAYCNDLLSVCFGPRFTVELITQAEKADGKGTKEVFELRVYDNLRGGDPRDLGDLSGGEQILVDEALKNALALFVNSRHAGAIETCWRDETTGPLDPENARRYIEMLRRVQQLGGFRHVLYVSHNADAAALADTQVRLEDGRLTVCRPPFTEAA